MKRTLVAAALMLACTNLTSAQPGSGNTARTRRVETIRLVLGAVGPGATAVGKAGTYMLTLKNEGDTPARQVVLTHELPAGFRFVSADGGRFDPATHRVTWAWNELAPGSKKELRLNAEAVNAGEWTHKLEAHDERGTRVRTEFPTRIESAAPANQVEEIEP